jgi:hypothetical protein
VYTTRPSKIVAATLMSSGPFGGCVNTSLHTVCNQLDEAAVERGNVADALRGLHHGVGVRLRGLR